MTNLFFLYAFTGWCSWHGLTDNEPERCECRGKLTVLSAVGTVEGKSTAEVMHSSTDL